MKRRKFLAFLGAIPLATQLVMRGKVMGEILYGDSENNDFLDKKDSKKI